MSQNATEIYRFEISGRRPRGQFLDVDVEMEQRRGQTFNPAFKLSAAGKGQNTFQPQPKNGAGKIWQSAQPDVEIFNLWNVRQMFVARQPPIGADLMRDNLSRRARTSDVDNKDLTVFLASSAIRLRRAGVPGHRIDAHRPMPIAEGQIIEAR